MSPIDEPDYDYDANAINEIIEMSMIIDMLLIGIAVELRAKEFICYAMNLSKEVKMITVETRASTERQEEEQPDSRNQQRLRDYILNAPSEGAMVGSRM